MKAVFENRNVKIDDIPFLKRTSIWNAMTNNFVYTCAAGSREGVVVQRRGICILAYYEVVNGFVDLFGSDAYFYHGVSQIKSLSTY